MGIGARTRALGALAFLLACAVAAPARADMPPRQSALQAETHPELARTWRRIIELLDKEDFEDLLHRVEELDAVRRRAGLPNLYEAAAALSRVAMARAEAGAPETGFRLARAAIALAPDLPTPHYTMAATAMVQDPGNIFRAAGYLARGWLLELRHLPSQLTLLARLAAALLFAHVIVLALVALAYLRRHLRTLAHDARHLFPRGVSTFQGGLFALILLLAPLYLGLGLIALFLLWVVATWWYQSRGEKTVTILLLLGTAATPLLGMVHDHALRHPSSPSAQAHACLQGACSEPQVAGLESDCAAQPGGSSCLAFALVRARQGALTPPLLDDAARALAALDGSPVLSPASLDNLRGNVWQAQAVAACLRRERQGLRGDDDSFRGAARKSAAAYERAAEQGLGAVADYNRSLLLRRLGEESQADALRTRALDSGQAIVQSTHDRVSDSPSVGPCDEAFNANELLVWERPDAGPLVFEGFRGDRLHALRLPALHDTLVGAHGHRGLLDVIVGSILLVVLLSASRRYVRPSWRCVQCDHVGCARCRVELTYLDICEECLFLKVKGSFVDAKELWFRERSIQQRQRRQRTMGRLLTFLVPGGGHLLRGRAVAGFLLVFAFAASLLNALGATSLCPDPELVRHGAGAVGPALWAILAGLVYLVAVVSAHRGR